MFASIASQYIVKINHLKYIIINLLLLLLGCISNEQKLESNSSDHLVIFDGSQTSKQINDKVQFIYKPIVLNAESKLAIKPNPTEIIQTDSRITLGNYQDIDEAWFYLQIANLSKSKKNLVLAENGIYRCDSLEGYELNNNSLINLSSRNEGIAISRQILPFSGSGVPFSINKNDTLTLILRTVRNYGVHEIDLYLTEEKAYFKEVINWNIYKYFELMALLICIVILLTVSYFFKDLDLMVIGLYFFFVFFTLFSYSGIPGEFALLRGIGLSKVNYGPFSIFILNAAYHPFAIIQMREIRHNRKAFLVISFFLLSINLLMAGLYFLPLQIFLEIDFILPYALSLLTIFNLVWLFFSGIIAFIRSNKKYLLLAYSVAFVPYIIEQIVFAMANDYSILLSLRRSRFLITFFAVTIISIYQLRERLISKKKYEINVEKIRLALNQIRKEEIESIGRNLHDSIGNTLATALGYLNLKTPNTSVSQKLLIESIKEIRFLSHNLVKDEQAPLKIKLENLIDRFNDFSQISFEFSDYTEGLLAKLDELTQQNIYMIIQEILTNIIKHSKATEAFVQVFKTDNLSLQFNIEDDGIGFNTTADFKGIGLKNIQKRAEISSLKISLDSNHSGTNVIVETKPIV